MVVSFIPYLALIVHWVHIGSSVFLLCTQSMLWLTALFSTTENRQSTIAIFSTRYKFGYLLLCHQFLNCLGVSGNILLDQHNSMLATYQCLVIRGANSDPYVESKFGNQNSKTDSELNSEIRFIRIRI